LSFGTNELMWLMRLGHRQKTIGAVLAKTLLLLPSLLHCIFILNIIFAFHHAQAATFRRPATAAYNKAYIPFSALPLFFATIFSAGKTSQSKLLLAEKKVFLYKKRYAGTALFQTAICWCASFIFRPILGVLFAICSVCWFFDVRTVNLY